MRERILAVVGAIGLVVGALFLRSVIAGDGGTGDGSSDGSGSSGRTTPVVACAPDLRSVCDALADDGLITAAPSTLDLVGAAAQDIDVDGWITWDPAPGVANFDRPDTWSDLEPLASAPLGVLVAGTSEGCDAAPTWESCVIASADRGVPVGVGTGTTAQSLARLHPIAAALVPADGGFTDVSATSLRDVVNSTQIDQSDYARQINTFLTQRGALGMVVGPVPALEAATLRQPTATVAIPTPEAQLTVVVVTHRTTGDRSPITGGHLLRSEAARTAFEALGLVPATGTASDLTRAGEVHSIREKLR